MLVGDECDRLRRGDGDRRDEQTAPVAEHCHDGRRGEHEAGERRAGCREAVLQRDRNRHEHRADEPERRERLGPPGERDRRTEGGDRGGRGQCERRRDQVVERRRGEQRRVEAGDAGACRRDGCVRVAVAPTQPDAGADERSRGGRPEGDPRRRADPAAVDGEHEEEDDAEERHDAAGPRERTRAEQHAQVERLARWPGRTCPGDCPWDTSGWCRLRCGPRRRGRGGCRLEHLPDRRLGLARRRRCRAGSVMRCRASARARRRSSASSLSMLRRRSSKRSRRTVSWVMT